MQAIWSVAARIELRIKHRMSAAGARVLTSNGQPQILQRGGGQLDDHIEAVNLLPQVDGHGLRGTSR